MNVKSKEEASAPKGVIGCLAAGFEILGRNLGLLVIPVLLDLFLWLGPRLSVAPLVRGFVTVLKAQPALDPEMALQIEQAMQLLEQFGEQFNLLSLLSWLPLLHPPSLLARHTVEDISVEDPPLEEVIAEMFSSADQPPQRDLGQVPDPLRSQLRTLTGMAGERYALIPASLIYFAASPGARAELTLVMVDVRTGRVGWRTVASSSGPPPTVSPTTPCGRFWKTGRAICGSGPTAASTATGTAGSRSTARRRA